MEQIINLIKQCACEIEGSFIEDPFKYFNEKDLHFAFQECWKKSCPKGPFHIHREYPVLVEAGEFGAGQKKEYKNGYIDIVITNLNEENKEKPIFGIEMFLGKYIDEGVIEINSREYIYTKSNINSDIALQHLDQDVYKLQKAMQDNYFLFYFIIHLFSRETSGRRNERIQRISQITDELRNYSNVDKDRLVIIEILFENGMRTNREELGLREIESPSSLCDESLTIQPNSKI